jgi:hypothetical protein
VIHFLKACKLNDSEEQGETVMTIPSERMNHSEELLRAFGIQFEDLEVNRAGRLGPAQSRKLLSSGNSNLAGAFLIGLLLAGILYGLANKPLVPIQWILSIILFVIVLTVGIRYFAQTRAAVAEGRVETLVGPVHVQSRGRAGWYLVVAGQSFQLPVRPWQIQREALYRVYFVPRTNSVVAMEPAVDQ